MPSMIPVRRHLVWWCGALQIMLLAGYCLLVLYPAYQSGLAYAGDPTADAAALVGDAHAALTQALSLGFLALFWCVVPLCSLVVLLALVLPGTRMSRMARWRYIALLCACWGIILATLPAANAFLLWLLD